MPVDTLLRVNAQAQTGVATEPLLTPLERLIGGQDLGGRVDAFLLYAEAADYSRATLRAYKDSLGDFVRFANSLGVTTPEAVTEEICG